MPSPWPRRWPSPRTKGITIVAPVMGDDGNAKVVTIKPAYVFDVSQTGERQQRAA